MANTRRTGKAIEPHQAIHDGHALLLVFCILKRYGGQRRNEPCFVIPRAVAQSSNSGPESFCCYFLDAATTRSMTGGARSMTGGARSIASRYSPHSVGSSTPSFRAQSRNPGTPGSECSTGLSGCCDCAQHDRWYAPHDS